MKASRETNPRPIPVAVAAIAALFATTQIGLADGPNFDQQRVTLGAITFEDGATDYSIERAGGVRLEFEVDNGGGDLFMFAEKATGRIGFGDSTTPPELPFHFRPTDDGSDAAILVDNQDQATVAERNMLQLRNNGAPRLVLEDISNARAFAVGMSSRGDLLIKRSVAGSEIVIKRNGVIEMGPGTTTSFKVKKKGVLARNYGRLSDREAKHDIQELGSKEVLSKIKVVPVSSWRFKGDDDAALHIGPMAQDFYQVFGTGTSDQVISLGDMAGVALAGVRSLIGELELREAEVKALGERLDAQRSRSAELEERIARLEQLLKMQDL